MGILLTVLAILVAFWLLGAIIHLLWIIAVVLTIVWLVGFIVSRSHPQRRWYRW